ncbi:hypothetical protein NDU88_006558 [Pleurodeles waltl]|uniref:Uncharacterized protein n=1 Tax=Pleurodeles waltl TaxID=8319 RepID=A0AAV7MCL3_PLEWA|nr:hypothetical protein NDU88_006558 [Pleurodeles waltl]
MPFSTESDASWKLPRLLELTTSLERLNTGDGSHDCGGATGSGYRGPLEVLVAVSVAAVLAAGSVAAVLVAGYVAAVLVVCSLEAVLVEGPVEAVLAVGLDGSGADGGLCGSGAGGGAGGSLLRHTGWR